MSLIRLPRLSAMAAMVLIAPLFMTAPASPVSAQNDFADLDCNDLWYARNQLFAHYGHCFKSARGKAAFHNKPDYPNVCKPPHGKLPANAAVDVASIKQVERSKGCK
jgi:hypothetical protein